MSLLRVTPQIQLTFRCDACGQLDVYEDARAAPVHCGQPMAHLKHLWIGGDPDRTRLACLRLTGKYTKAGWPVTDRAWPSHWDPAYELWRFKEARLHGERIGWFGKATLHWEWIMVPGCVPPDGIAVTKEDAVSKMWTIINSIGKGLV